MKTTDMFVFFWNGIYSNWFPSEYYDPVAGLRFGNTEQGFMWWKADFFRDYNTRDAIALVSTDPQQVKRYGRQIQTYNDEAWSSVRYGYMLWSNKCKFNDNLPLARILKDTGDRVLVEASPYDCVWGIKMSEDDPLIEDPQKWQGSNLLGKVLMEVRYNLK